MHLILAGAGWGKTRVLTTRIAWLLQTGQVSPAGVMAVTFTNKAAKEMLTRLSAMLPVNVRGMWIGTFHGLCNRFLRAHWKLAGLPQSFQILDAQDTVSAVKRVIKAMNLDEERFVPRQVSWFIAASKEDGLRPRDVTVRDEQTRRLVEIYQAYEDQCQREGVVDFAELLLRSYELSPMSSSTSSRTPIPCKPKSSGGFVASRSIAMPSGPDSESDRARFFWSAIRSRRSIDSGAPMSAPMCRRATHSAPKTPEASCQSLPTSVPAPRSSTSSMSASKPCSPLMASRVSPLSTRSMTIATACAWRP